MKPKIFKEILNSMDKLNSDQFRRLQEFIDEIRMKKRVSALLETEYTEIKCPNCASESKLRWGKRSDLQRYRCKSCGRTYNSLSSSPLARLRRKGHWVDYSECLKEGMTIKEAAKRCGVSIDTAFRWRHRFLHNNGIVKPENLMGIVEGKGIFVPKSYKGSTNNRRKSRKRGSKNNNESRKGKVCLFFGIDRHKLVYDFINDKLNLNILNENFATVISRDSLFCSENKSLYKNFSLENSLRHGKLNVAKGEFVKKDIVHIKNVNNYTKKFIEWIFDHFKGVATKYMSNYMGWHRFRDEFEYDIKPETILFRAKSGGIYKTQPLIRIEH